MPDISVKPKGSKTGVPVREKLGLEKVEVELEVDASMQEDPRYSKFLRCS